MDNIHKHSPIKLYHHLATNAEAQAMIRALRAFPQWYAVIHNKQAGTCAVVGVTPETKDIPVFRALQKSSNGPWIVSSAKGLFSYQ